jgi:hypothetical protein
MGWGLEKKYRDELLGPSVLVRQKNAKAKGRSEVLDMNAVIRLFARPDQTIESVTNRAIRASLPASVSRMFAVFDRAATMPRMRASLHRARYSNKMPMSDSLLRQVKATHGAGKVHRPARQQQIDFNMLFHPGPTKKLAWQLFAEATWHECVTTARRTQHVELYYPNGASAVMRDNTQPGTYSQAVESLGEADLSAFEIAVRESLAGHPVTIRSVDTDLILQTVAYGMHMDKPFSPQQPFVLRLSKGVTLSGVEICKRFGGNNPSHRLSAAFWMIFAGGTDYSKPASDQGFLKRDLAAMSLVKTKVLEVTPARQVFLHSNNLNMILSGLKRRNIKGRSGRPPAITDTDAYQQPRIPKPIRSLQDAVYEACRSACYYGGYCSTGNIQSNWELLGGGKAQIV